MNRVGRSPRERVLMHQGATVGGDCYLVCRSRGEASILEPSCLSVSRTFPVELV